MASAVIALKDIPSLSVLYRTKRLKPSTAPSEELPNPNQQYNDRVCTIQGDITKLGVDAIVNAANRSLRGGGGVDGAIHRAAGPGLLRECITLNGCPTGSAKITGAYGLPCKNVIHAVGPIFRNSKESEPLLSGCYRTALALAVQNNCRSIAFPAISCGIYGYPSERAACTAVQEVFTFLGKPESAHLDKIIFCNFMDKDVNAYADVLPEAFPPTDDDLAHAGEYNTGATLPPSDDLPTCAQNGRPDQPEPRDATKAIKMDPDNSNTVSPDKPTVLKRSSPSRDESPPKRRRSSTEILENANTTQKMQTSSPENDEKPSKEAQAGAVSDEIASTPVKRESEPCDCSELYMVDACEFYGMWPSAALKCPCCRRIIASRHTSMPAIG